MNADKFQEASLIYDSDFKLIIEYISRCHQLMLVKYKNEKIENNENKIRNRMYKDFLNSDITKAEVNIFPCRFECEAAEIDDNYNETGYIDIKILTQSSLVTADAYYIIECKRIDGKKELNKKYIEEGILRFVEEKYPSYYSVSGMIGFVVEHIDISNNIKDINKLMENYPKVNLNKPLKALNNNKSNNTYSSVHKKEKSNLFKLYHLMLDFSTIVV